jgi:hypothetical protein
MTSCQPGWRDPDEGARGCHDWAEIGAIRMLTRRDPATPGGGRPRDPARPMGCRYAQGYHFARPVDPEAFEALTRVWTSRTRAA